MEMRDIINKMVKEEIDRARPRYRYAKVDSIDHIARTAGVIFTGETNPVQVNMGFVQPSFVGQTVRIEGIGTDKFITDVMGQASWGNFADLFVDRIRVRSTADASEDPANVGEPFIIGDENGVHVVLDNNELMAFTSNGVMTSYAFNTGATVPAGSITSTGSVVNKKYTDDTVNAQTINRPMLLLQKTTAQDSPTSTDTLLTWNNEILDTDTMWTSGADITIKTAGVYLFVFHSQFGQIGNGTNGTNTERTSFIVKNRTDNASGLSMSSHIGNVGTMGHSVMAVSRMAVNDKIRAGVWHASGGTIPHSSAGRPSHFLAEWMAP